MCHPDIFASIPVAQNVILDAVQTINEIIDACEESAIEGASSVFLKNTISNLRCYRRVLCKKVRLEKNHMKICALEDKSY